MRNGKTCVLLGITGGIAAYKSAGLCSSLVKKDFDVQTIATKHACEFVGTLTFETLTGNRCVTDMFDPHFPRGTEHISFAKAADLLLIAPATANVIAKLAHGLADDMLTTTALACKCPKLVAPAMNTAMLQNPATQDNLKKLEEYGWIVIPPAGGRLACGDVGEGKLADESVILSYIDQYLPRERDLIGKKILVTAGPTAEDLDPVRFLTNHSSGKMGFAIAKAAARRGADVTLVAGPVNLPDPLFMEVVHIRSARDMFEAVTGRSDGMDIIIKAAAVADYRPMTYADEKIKKKDSDLSIPLARTDDILGYLGAHRKDGQFLCGFSMETENMLENSRAKLLRKNIDMIAANNVKVEGAGFALDTNVITLITKEKETALPLLSKDDAADALLDAISKSIKERIKL